MKSAYQEELAELLEVVAVTDVNDLVVFNDDFNTFDHVINCLIDACGHNEFQAHQCALVVHNAGRCAVFIDSHDACESVYEYFIKCKLKTTLEKHDTKNS